MQEIIVYKHDPEAILPKRHLEFDAGLDLFALNDVFIPHGMTVVVPTGIAVNILPGYVGKIKDRSGCAKKGLSVGGGVIDHGFSGAIGVVIHNLTHKEGYDFSFTPGYQVKKGDRIAQLVIFKCELPKVIEVKKLWKGERGEKGFNSSGR